MNPTTVRTYSSTGTSSTTGVIDGNCSSTLQNFIQFTSPTINGIATATHTVLPILELARKASCTTMESKLVEVCRGRNSAKKSML